MAARSILLALFCTVFGCNSREPDPVVTAGDPAAEQSAAVETSKPDSASDELVPTDLARFGMFLTIDLPAGFEFTEDRSAAVRRGDEFELRITKISDESFIQLAETKLNEMREDIEPPTELLVDTPEIVAKGATLLGTEIYSCQALRTVAGEKYTIVSGLVDREGALLVARCAESLRRTAENEAAEQRMHAAKARFEELGCEFGFLDASLSLEGEMVTDGDLALLADLPMVHWLTFHPTNLTSACLEHLRPMAGLLNVQYYSDHIDGSWLAPLGEVPALRQLMISAATISAEQWDGLGQLQQVDSLDLRIEVDRHCLQAIGKLPELDSLDLNDTGIDDETLSALSLRADEDIYLQLNGNPITDAGLKHLYPIKKLYEVSLEDTEVTEAGVKALKEALPQCRVYQ